MSDRGNGATSPVECADAAGHCALCGDVAEVGVALTVDGMTQTAVVRFDAKTAVVALDLVDAVCAGDTLLVHQGFAVTKVTT